jgi:hypothetical protein
MCGELIKNSETARKQRDYSIIHWNTGEPKEEGEYLVVVFGRKIEVDYWFAYDDIEDGRITTRFSWKENWLRKITAWCKTSDIKLYKEENE